MLRNSYFGFFLLIPLIQHHLESLYQIRIGQNAQNYLMTENDLKLLLPANQCTVLPRELFLVNPNPKDETLEIALFLAHDLQQNLKTHNPLKSLSEKNIVDFCTLIEGVSHFVCYLHKAALDRPVTELELELQAEIDKFLLLNLSIQPALSDPPRRRVEGSTQSIMSTPNQILDLLFEGYSTHAHLTTTQDERYHTANNLARRYCYKLSGLIRKNDQTKLIQEARTFYPLSQEEKIKRIQD